MTACRVFDDWPELLLGPMVRRVTAESVSVFIATSVVCEARLAVTAGWVPFEVIDDADFTADPVALDRIGERLWVGLLEASLPPGTMPGDELSYDVQLITPDGPRRLEQLGQLGNSTDPILEQVPLGYVRRGLPSFLVPPSEIGALRLAHTSCRKPHGGVDGEPDALGILDEVISLSLGTSVPMPASAPHPPPASNRERPHQLILTGDQIYADDVAAGLLAALTEAGNHLMGWTEFIPGVESSVNEFMAWPGWRSRLLHLQDIVPLPGKEDYSANHLLSFGEWCAMYIFAWSDALWARSEDKKAVELPKVDPRLHFKEVADAVAAVEQISSWTGIPPIIPAAYTRWVWPVQVLEEFNAKIAEDWEQTLDQAMRYGASVRYVRRLLANVATYTMFDDHEITDDWFLNRDKTDRLLGVGAEGWTQDIGPRLLRNGLSAYAFFQHWGNIPEDFGSRGPGVPRDETALGVQLLRKWSMLPPRADGLTVPPPDLAGTQVDVGAEADPATRAADGILGIDVQPSPPPPPGTRREDFTRMRWDYTVEFDTHRLLALDTRTWRFFPDAERFVWPSDIPPAEQTPSDKAALAHMAGVVDELTRKAQTAQNQAASAFAALLGAALDAALAASDATTEASLLEFASTAEVLLQEEPPLWTDDAFDLANDELHRFREVLEPDGGGTSGELARADQLWKASLFLHSLASIPTEGEWEPLGHSLAALGRVLEAVATGSSRALAGSVASLVKAMGIDLIELFFNEVTAEDAVVVALNAAGSSVAQYLNDLETDEHSENFFRDGSHQLGAGLISDAALRFQVTEPLAAAGVDLPGATPTILLSPAPIFGNSLVEAAQRGKLVLNTLSRESAAEAADYDAWSINTPAMHSLLRAARALPRCLVLSGDVHYANSSVNDVEILGEADPVQTRYVQLTSSSARNAVWGETNILGFIDDTLWLSGGEFFMTQMSLSKNPGDPTLPAWAREMVEEWAAETLSLETLAEWLYGQWEQYPHSLGEFIEWNAKGTYNTATAWGAEALYIGYSVLNLVSELQDDPLGTIFGDFLFAPDILRQQLLDLYKAWGVDPSLGPQIRRTMLRDLREGRLDLYPARVRYTKKPPNITGWAHLQWVQTVGGNNVGLVRFMAEDNAISSVRHELLWFPVQEEEEGEGPQIPPKPAGLVVGAQLPRTDWMGTLHEGSWTAYAHRLDDHYIPSGPAVS